MNVNITISQHEVLGIVQKSTIAIQYCTVMAETDIPHQPLKFRPVSAVVHQRISMFEKYFGGPL
jgi:hypothetical protein